MVDMEARAHRALDDFQAQSDSVAAKQVNIQLCQSVEVDDLDAVHSDCGTRR